MALRSMGHWQFETGSVPGTKSKGQRRLTTDHRPMTADTKKKRILSGIQPSGKLHLGNYFGAIKQHIALQEEGNCFYFIANYHALTTVRDTTRDLADSSKKPVSAADLLRQNTVDVALDYLACGLDPARAVRVRQSY